MDMGEVVTVPVLPQVPRFRFNAPSITLDHTRMRFPPPMSSGPSTSFQSEPSMAGPSVAGHTSINHLRPGGGGTTGADFQPYYLRPAYRFKPQIGIGGQTQVALDPEGGPGRRLRKNVSNVRRHVDYVANVLHQLEARVWQSNNENDRPMVQPDLLYATEIFPPAALKQRPIDCVLTKFVRAAQNKVKCPIYDICWTPEGRRLITGASTGEFTLWNGTAFNFETILQAHDTAIRALKWSHNDHWLISADQDGFVKYWQANMNNVHMYQAHKEAVRCVRSVRSLGKVNKNSLKTKWNIWNNRKKWNKPLCIGFTLGC